MRMRTSNRLGLGGLLCFGLAGCNAILGIEAARVDPRLSTGTEPASASAEVPDAWMSTPDDGGNDASLGEAGAAQPSASWLPGLSASIGPDAEPSLADASSTATEPTVTSTAVPSAETEPTAVSADASAPDAGSDAAPLGPEPTVCETYCTEVMELCTGNLKQYRDLRQCEKICGLLPEGEVGSSANENTAACRLRYASKGRYAAGTELEAYCRQAGPGGDGKCGSNCEGYCSLTMSVCTDESAGIYHFDDVGECLQTCEALPVSPLTYTTTGTEVSDGDHVQCRLFHVTSAAMLDAEEHCEHALGVTLCESSATP
jgi:hypothetical protein